MKDTAIFCESGLFDRFPEIFRMEQQKICFLFHSAIDLFFEHLSGNGTEHGITDFRILTSNHTSAISEATYNFVIDGKIVEAYVRKIHQKEIAEDAENWFKENCFRVSFEKPKQASKLITAFQKFLASKRLEEIKFFAEQIEKNLDLIEQKNNGESKEQNAA